VNSALFFLASRLPVSHHFRQEDIRMKRTLTFACLALSFAGAAFAADPVPAAPPTPAPAPAVTAPAPPPPDKQHDIRTLMALTGAGKIGAQFVEQMMASFKETYPDVPASFWTAFVSEINADTLVDKLVPVYEKHLTQDDIRQLIAFYQSPTGKKMIVAMPKITRDSMQIGQDWGRQVAEQVVARMEKEGFKK
jgi:hypothetical protein